LFSAAAQIAGKPPRPRWERRCNSNTIGGHTRPDRSSADQPRNAEPAADLSTSTRLSCCRLAAARPARLLETSVRPTDATQGGCTRTDAHEQRSRGVRGPAAIAAGGRWRFIREGHRVSFHSARLAPGVSSAPGKPSKALTSCATGRFLGRPLFVPVRAQRRRRLACDFFDSRCRRVTRDLIGCDGE
jgi:hypothetical protein